MDILYWTLVLPLAALVAWHVRRSDIGFGTCAAWALLTLAHGLLVKPLFVQFEFPSRELLELTLLTKISFDEYWQGGVAVLLPYAVFMACLFFAGAYGRRPPAAPALPRRVTWFHEGVLSVLALVALAGLVGFFIQFPQLLESANKNTIATADIAEYNSGGIWRALAELGFVVAMCALVNLGLGRRPRLNRALFVVSAALWLAFGFLSDQRGLVMFAVVTYFIAYGRYVAPVSRVMLAGIGVVLLLFIVSKTAMRLQGEGGGAGLEDLSGVMTNFIGQNLVENGKTTTIVKSVPHLLDYQFGKTYLDAVLILIPRALYPDKSTVNLDTVVGNAIFDCDAFGACGVPPGLVAESYLNFGYLGVALLPALVGLLIGWLDRRFRVPRRGSVGDLFFVYALIYVGMAILGSGLSSTITQLLLQALEIGLVGLLAGAPGLLRRAANDGPSSPAPTPPRSRNAVLGAGVGAG